MAVQIIYAGEYDAPLYPSVFLAGPTPRSSNVKSWRPDAVLFFECLNLDITLFIPETRDGGFVKTYADQIEWEEHWLSDSDCIMFWVPRDMDGGMPALTTNIEWGRWHTSGKVVFGAPERADKVRYMRYYCTKLDIFQTFSLKELVAEAHKMAVYRYYNRPL